MELLDEVGDADVADLFSAKDFMVHFQLKTEADNMEEPVPVELEGFGDETYDALRASLPCVRQGVGKVVDDLLTSDDVTNEKRDAAIKLLNEALVTERMRKWIQRSPNCLMTPMLQNAKRARRAKAGGREGSEGASPACDHDMPSHGDKLQ